MGTFNPRNLKVRVGHQATEGLPGLLSAISFKDIRVNPGSSPTPAWQRIEDPRIDGAAYQAVRLDGIIENGPFALEMSLNAEEIIYFLGWAAQNSAHSVLVGSALQEQFVIDTGATAWSDFFVLQVDRADDYPILFYDCRVVSITITAEGNSIVGATVTIAAAGHHQFADGTIVNNATNDVQIRGLMDPAFYGQATAAEQRVYIKMTDVTNWAAGSGYIICKAEVGAAAAASYGATTFNLYADTWTQVLKSDGVDDTLHNRVGDSAQPIQIYIDSAETPTLDDELYFQFGQSSWTPSYTASPSLASPHATLLYDTADIKIDAFTVTWNVPNLRSHGPGAKFEKVNLRQGAHIVEVELERRYIDYLLAEQRRGGANASNELPKFEFQVRSKSTFANGYAYAVIGVCPAVDFTGEDPAADAENYTETVTGTGHEDTAESWAVAPINFRVVNSLATPAA